ncbi:hypothetical protein ACLOJK_033238 [Asimina triloba]
MNKKQHVPPEVDICPAGARSTHMVLHSHLPQSSTSTADNHLPTISGEPADPSLAPSSQIRPPATTPPSIHPSQIRRRSSRRLTASSNPPSAAPLPSSPNQRPRSNAHPSQRLLIFIQRSHHASDTVQVRKQQQRTSLLPSDPRASNPPSASIHQHHHPSGSRPVGVRLLHPPRAVPQLPLSNDGQRNVSSARLCPDPSITNPSTRRLHSDPAAAMSHSASSSHRPARCPSTVAPSIRLHGSTHPPLIVQPTPHPSSQRRSPMTHPDPPAPAPHNVHGPSDTRASESGVSSSPITPPCRPPSPSSTSASSFQQPPFHRPMTHPPSRPLDPAPANDDSTPIKWAISDPATI